MIQYNKKDKQFQAQSLELKIALVEKKYLKEELRVTKDAYEKFKYETLTVLNNFKQYKSKLEKDAVLHKENIYSYISVIERKNKIIQMLSEHHESCNLNK